LKKFRGEAAVGRFLDNHDGLVIWYDRPVFVPQAANATITAIYAGGDQKVFV
jgi:hypothetical protein